jgi:hypothetical protein
MVRLSQLHSYPGMAHFADTGPFGATCHECVFYGYWQQRRNQSGDLIKTSFCKNACRKFFELTHSHGPAVPANASACRYFERRKENEPREKM